MNTSKLKPLNGRIILEVLDEVEKMKGGIHLLESSQEKSNIGRVIRTGEESSIKVGAKVMFSRYAGTALRQEGKEYLLILEKDLLGEFDEDAE